MVSIITVTYNNSKNIADCLKSLDKYTKTPHEIIIIDNNSSDNTLDVVKKSGVKVNLLSQKQNFGFSKGNNIGVENATGEYLMFINPDTQIMNHAVDEMLSYLKDNKDVGLVSPKLIRSSGEDELSIRKLPTIIGAFKEYYLKQKNEYEPFSLESKEPTNVECVVGAAMLLPASVYKQVGGFDNKFFLYYEDLDLCKKLKDNKYRIVYYPDAKVKHIVGASSRSNPKSLELLHKSAKIYHGLIQYYLLQLVLHLRKFV